SPHFLPLFLPASSSLELRKHADTTRRTRQINFDPYYRLITKGILCISVKY
ncbi:hypothetical protein M91_10797, partial [Bos mutus]